MADFQKIIPLTLAYEGKLVNAKNDKGGITNYGVSLKFAQATKDLHLFDINRDGRIDANDIRSLTEEQAVLIYKKYFWDIYNMDEFSSDKIAFVYFDASVNHGGKMATKILQKALNAIGFDLVVDGCFGKKTFAAIEEADEEELVKAYQSKRTDYYNAIVSSNPSQRVFLKGWLNRIQRINSDLQEL